MLFIVRICFIINRMKYQNQISDTKKYKTEDNIDSIFSRKEKRKQHKITAAHYKDNQDII